MNQAIIMLGSNDGADINLKLAKQKLSFYFEILKESKIIVSKPVGIHYQSDFNNKALLILSDKTLENSIATLKKIEVEMGRKPENKQAGNIPIDIDLIFWNDKLVHTDYDRFEYVRKCIEEIR
ncbi:MAG: 2-amino-4-hydroxy-6-hydroxymethyldihydropteridine diphosphokinase [Paludibacter sp.]|nr:2-amino-4-hydroxy-6-hydroxymethyldihydropteridine diphosphokinase [Paludibacter sp.]